MAEAADLREDIVEKGDLDCKCLLEKDDLEECERKDEAATDEVAS